MSAANPLVASPHDAPSSVSGAYLLQDADDIARAIHSGDWGAGALAAASGALDTVAAVIDPIGTLIANGLGWLLDHLEPLKSWFDDFTGDAAEVAAFSHTWQNVSTHLQSLSARYQSSLADLDTQSGATIDAYLAHARGMIAQLHGAGTWAGAMATGLGLASTLVQMVHDIVRDAIAQVVGTAIAATATVALTLGFGTPLALAEVGIRVSALVARIGRIVPDVIHALSELRHLLERLGHSITAATRHLHALPPGAAGRAQAAAAPEAAKIPRVTAHPQFANTPAWLQKLLDDPDLPPWQRKRLNGIAFNYEQHPRYPENEVRTATGKRLDSYIPGDEIVSRKYTQLSEIKESTARSYLAEIMTKYAPGTPLADGRRLRGDPYLEVPVQTGDPPVPLAVIHYANSFDPPITIRDVAGQKYN